jgi:hypothetical protein
MKIISSKTVGNKKRVVIECEPHEQPRVFNPDGHYRLHEPHEDVVHADQILYAVPATWCVVEQKWVT